MSKVDAEQARDLSERTQIGKWIVPLIPIPGKWITHKLRRHLVLWGKKACFSFKETGAKPGEKKHVVAINSGPYHVSFKSKAASNGHEAFMFR